MVDSSKREERLAEQKINTARDVIAWLPDDIIGAQLIFLSVYPKDHDVFERVAHYDNLSPGVPSKLCSPHR